MIRSRSDTIKVMLDKRKMLNISLV